MSFDSIQNPKNSLRPNVQISNRNLRPNTGLPKKSRLLKTVLLFIIVLAILLGGAVYLRASNLAGKIFVGGKFTFWDIPKTLLGEDQKLLGEESGQINILLLGIGGEGHDGPYLSDTIMLAQIKPETNTVSLVSIPRDFEVTLPEGYGKQKINAAFAYGLGKERNDFNSAGLWARQQVEKISGLTIPYFAVLDFNGFKKAIDIVEGVEVNIETTFTDAEYPNSTFGYLPPQTFKQGLEVMNGERALIFARSRHGNNNEGSDFARSKRQKKIIEAFKTKALSLNLISDSSTLNNLLGVFADHFHTNISPAEILHLYKLTKEEKISRIFSSSLDPATQLVCDGKNPDTGAYIVFVCPNKTPQDIYTFFKNSLSVQNLSEEKPVIWLGNSTDSLQKYTAAEKRLAEAGVNVLQVGYSKDFLSQTIYYIVNPKPATEEFLKTNFGAVKVDYPPKDMKIDNTKVDVIMILGVLPK